VDETIRVGGVALQRILVMRERVTAMDLVMVVDTMDIKVVKVI